MKKMIRLVVAVAMLTLSAVSALPAGANAALPEVNWLPPISNQGEFQLKDGSTLPIKFTLTDPGTGAFVEDNGVSVDVNKVLFRDDFNDGNADGWTPVNSDTSWSVVDGVLRCTPAITYPRILVDDTLEYENYIFEADARLISGKGYALLFRATDHNNFYSFQYDPGAGNKLRLSQFESPFPTYSDVADMIPYTIDDQWHHLKVAVFENNIKCYVDGNLVFNVDDTVPPAPWTGGIGFRTWAWASAEFDNVMVVSLPAAETFEYGEGSNNVRISYDTVFLDTFSAVEGMQPDNPWQDINGNWEASGYEYQQTENIYIPGARSFAGDISWTNYVMTAKVKISDDGWGGVLLRANSIGDTYYELYLQRGGQLQLVKTVGGTRTGITNPSVGTFADQWWYVKAFVNGSNIKGKAWPASGSEPSSWLIDWTDTAAPIMGGRIGLITFSWWLSQLPVFFDDVSVKMPHYIANLHTKESEMTTGVYLITVWSGSGNQLGTYLFDLTDAIQGKGRGKGKA